MIPTLAGRVQTRLFVLATVGAVLTALLTLLLPMSFADAYLVLLAVALVGVGWELLYHLLMQFRWDKDWPTMFGLVTAVPEGLVMWVLLDAGLVPGVQGPLSWWAFATMFAVVWLGQWLFVNGPMRVLFVKWRLRGGRLL
ncbi:hypothetical protein EDD27_5957 [Nonomuraea polychroma]|uniref:Uncharacterized protein n=1 Tax=Nonomuraea polychroma TaxID=46176 RepID=A0A438MC19_9ACTN|nr:hypothetical protein [Nonomuraea polychroma]RVX43282.1 hypothetical protein EDD27_5957 [Nonomuraea polychroma]